MLDPPYAEFKRSLLYALYLSYCSPLILLSDISLQLEYIMHDQTFLGHLDYVSLVILRNLDNNVP